MPTYSYECTECGNRFDIVQSFTDDTLTTCEQCTGRLRKLFNSVGIVFKGSGFYRTDSRENGQKVVFASPVWYDCGDIFGNGRKQAFGNAFSKSCLRNSRQLTRSIGIAPWLIAPRCVRPAEARKPAQIPRIGANWEASII